jgi:S1-C subfamily serine protease
LSAQKRRRNVRRGGAVPPGDGDTFSFRGQNTTFINRPEDVTLSDFQNTSVIPGGQAADSIDLRFARGGPPDSAPSELKELRDLLALAYPRPASGDQLARQAEIADGPYSILDNVREVWSAVIRDAIDQGKLRRLVEIAAKDPEAAAFQSRFVDILNEGPTEVAPRQPEEVAHSGWWKGDDVIPAVATRLFPERLIESRSRLLRIELAAAVVAAAPSVAKLSLQFSDQRVHGTGFLITEDRILTNHHNVVDKDFGKVTNVVAEFDHVEQPPDVPLRRTGSVKHIVGDEKDDWAVVPLASSVDRAPLKLGSIFDIAVNDTVIIIQHPSGAAKQFSLEPLGVRYEDDRVVQYVADTQVGSSGSPVFDSRMCVIALHHAEAASDVAVEGSKQIIWRNEGIRIDRVMDALRNQGIPFESGKED